MTDTNTDATDAVGQLLAHPRVYVETTLPHTVPMRVAAAYTLAALGEDVVHRVYISPRADTDGSADGCHWPDTGTVCIHPDAYIPSTLTHEVSHAVYHSIGRPDLSTDAWADARLLSIERRGPTRLSEYRNEHTELVADALTMLVADPRRADDYPAFTSELVDTVAATGIEDVLPRGIRRRKREDNAQSRVMAVIG